MLWPAWRRRSSSEYVPELVTVRTENAAMGLEFDGSIIDLTRESEPSFIKTDPSLLNVLLTRHKDVAIILMCDRLAQKTAQLKKIRAWHAARKAMIDIIVTAGKTVRVAGGPCRRPAAIHYVGSVV
jgi:hypothetical protein